MASRYNDVIFSKQLIELRNQRPFFYKIKPHTKTTNDKHPKLWLVFDTEAHIEQITDEVEKQTLKFGYAIYNRYYKDRPIFTSDIQFFENKAQFADLLEHVVKQGSKLYVIAHNVGYDWVISDINGELTKRGWEMRFFSDSKGATIIPYRKEKKEIIFIDSMNWFRASLATIAAEFGLTKYDVDFYDTTEDKLKLHCKVDVMILDKIMKAWFKLIQDEDYGSFKPTIASQALEAFKQKFLDCEISTDQGLVQKDLERLCYYGGRTEANYIGDFDGGITCLDLNSAYPSVMYDGLYPIRYKESRRNPRVDDILSLPRDIGYFGEVEIECNVALYPVRLEDRLVFPTGRFITWLAMPELQQAIRKGHVVKIRTLHLYDLRPIFKDYIREIYGKRQAASANGLTAVSLMYKYMLNSLYGKFGEHKKVWTPVYESDNPENGYETVVNMETRKVEKYIHFNGKEYHLLNSSHKSHSFPLISAFVTSYLRVKMNEAIERVGQFNWVYCDTDSIYVTELGLKRMSDLINEDELGAWKIEKVGEGISIRGLKDYTFCSENKIKGIPNNAKQLDENKYEMRLLTTMHYAIEHGEMGAIYVYPLIKELDRSYKKGIVSAQGWVTPYRLEEFT